MLTLKTFSLSIDKLMIKYSLGLGGYKLFVCVAVFLNQYIAVIMINSDLISESRVFFSPNLRTMDLSDSVKSGSPGQLHRYVSLCVEIAGARPAPTRHLGANKRYASKNSCLNNNIHTLLSTTKCRVGARAQQPTPTIHLAS